MCPLKNNKYKHMKILKFTSIILITFCSIQLSAFKEKVKGDGNLITENRTTASYDKISAGGSFDILLIAGVEGKLTVEIEENLAKYLITEVKNDELKIHWKKGVNISQRKSVKITVPFKDISAVSFSGSGSIVSKVTVKSADLNLSMSGSGDIELAIDTTNLISNLSGSGTIDLTGSTDNLECSISGSGNLGGYGLTVNKNADTKISGSGNIKATINGVLNAKISGSGNIKYKGNPTKEVVKVSGSGNVTGT